MHMYHTCTDHSCMTCKNKVYFYFIDFMLFLDLTWVKLKHIYICVYVYIHVYMLCETPLVQMCTNKVLLQCFENLESSRDDINTYALLWPKDVMELSYRMGH